MKVYHKSETHTWETPINFFCELNDIFNFTLDCCAETHTAKVDRYYTIEDDALIQNWDGVVWCNPPYGREQKKFIEKAYSEYLFYGNTIVCLIPAKPDTKMWHDLIFKYASQVCFIKGRLRFGNSSENAPFPSALVVFSKNEYGLSKFGHVIKNVK